MRAALLAGLGLVLAACAAQPPGVQPIAAGESQADGIVTMASNGTLYNPVAADWRPAQDAADHRCRRWGHKGSTEFSGLAGGLPPVRHPRPMHPHHRDPVLFVRGRGVTSYCTATCSSA